MRLFIPLLLAAALTTAAPGRYQQQYQFQSSSASYKNNELEHKNDEAGFYAKQGDTDSTLPPEARTNYMQQEYRKPQSGESQTRVAVDGLLDDLRQVSRLPGQAAGHVLGAHGAHGHSQQYHQSHSHAWSESSQSTNSYGHRRPWQMHKPLVVVPVVVGGKLEEFDDDHEDYSRFRVHGFGKEYLEDTEGHLRPGHPREKPTTVATNTIFYQGGRQPSFGGPPRDLVTSSTNNKPSHSYGQTAFGGQEHDITQQTQHGFGKDDFDQDDLTQQTQDGFGKLEFGSQHKDEDLTQQTQDGFGKLEFGSQHKDEDLTQQTQDGFGKLEFGSHHKDEDMTQQTQDGFGKLEFGNHHKDEVTTRHIVGFAQQEYGTRYEDMTQQTQDGFGKLEFGNHDKDEDMTQQTQDGFGKLEFGSQHKDEDFTQQTQDSFGKHEYTNQHDKYHQQSNQFDNKETRNLEFGNHKQEDLAHQTQDGFSKLEFGSHTLDELTTPQYSVPQRTTPKYIYLRTTPKYNYQQTTPKYIYPQTPTRTIRYPGISQIGQEHHQYGSQHATHNQREDKRTFDDADDLTQQTQDGFDKLEIGSHHLTEQTQRGSGTTQFGTQHHGSSNLGFGRHQHDSDLQTGTHLHTIQSQDGKLVIGNQHHHRGDMSQEDMTQQTQDSKLEFHGHEDMSQQHMTQQTQDAFGKIESKDHQIDYTQQTQDGFGKLEFGDQHEDLTQQTQSGFDKVDQQSQGFGKLEFGQETQKHEDGYDKLEIGSQSVGTYRGNEHSSTQRAHRQFSSSSSSSFSEASSFSHQQSSAGSYHHQSNYGHSGLHYGVPKQVHEEISEEAESDMKAIEDIAQYAQKVQEMSQQAQKPSDYTQELEKVDGSHFNVESSRDIIEQGKMEEHLEEATTKKAGFWKRLGSSITTTYESAKEKTKTLAEKVKHNLG